MFKWRSKRIDQEDKLHCSSHELHLVYLSFSLLYFSFYTHIYIYLFASVSISPPKNSPIQANPKRYFYLLHLFLFFFFKSHQHGDHKPFVSQSFLCFVLDYFMYYRLTALFFSFFDLCYSNLFRFYFFHSPLNTQVVYKSTLSL